MDKRRVNWTELETHFMLIIIRDKNILTMLDGKKYRNNDIFNIVEEELKKRSYLKTALQIRTKWKALKLAYYKAKRANSISGSNRLECPFWEELDELLGHRPVCNVEGVDTSCVESEETPNSVDANYSLLAADVSVNDTETTIEDNQLSIEQIAGPSNELQKEPGPIRKKRKLDRKGSYNDALKSFSKDLKESQKEVAEMFIEKQAEMVAREFQQQREWEEKLLEEDRKATESMMANFMTTFFNNLRQISTPFHQPPHYSFFNPNQLPVTSHMPYPSPTSPTEITFPPSQILVPSPVTPNTTPLFQPVPGNECDQNKTKEQN